MKKKRIKLNHELTTKFKKSFTYKNKNSPRGIGIECEIPIVTLNGNAAPFSTIKKMFSYLEKVGFELIIDQQSKEVESARKMNPDSEENFSCCFDSITTDVGYSIIEIVLSPQINLWILEKHLSKLIDILKVFFKRHNCLMLGYGIQPLGYPSLDLMMPKERYFFFNKFSGNKIIPENEGSDACLLTITASNQCHVEIESENTIPAMNTLNALSGLQIALCANSPIWLGKVEKGIKANREDLWEHCFPNRIEQIGIPPKFQDEAHYVNYLLGFKPFLIEREGRFYRILNKETYAEYLEDDTSCFVESLNGDIVKVTPKIEDADQLFSCTWFNTRLVPKYGTIESRMCCQQPPSDTLSTSALTLGLIENLEVAKRFEEQYPLSFWKELRVTTIKNSLNVFIGRVSIVPLIKELLDIARDGLLRRNMNEEEFLKPLYDRLNKRESPADFAIEVFEERGINAFLKELSF
ncbi:Gamma-glutamylcysteine synthetase [Tenacibaculum sp. MAR_2009_124]|uniref:glutamate-cysteine ligase family protein n=1 Tax=Tenacibaculum sp. MAR_2009_124 TaxID=1250059 RepID=UPI000894A0C9|nr:glutamate-cysteine ligase family protein [Tenacibaculum sp. MAR_2009_124]SED07052.1 Gamma-glutamylcysteine synthetase [Tenacibaculum sp. MAR_2009_124]